MALSGVLAMRNVACVVCFVVLGLVEAGLQAGKIKCGELTCEPKQYCHSHLQACEQCEDVCNKESSNNYQEDVCNEHCQDYLHEQMFVTRNELSRDDFNLVVGRLTVLVVVTLVVSLLVLLALVATIVLIFWHRKQYLPPAYSDKNGKANQTNHVIQANHKTSETLKIEMPPPPPPPSTTTAPAPVTPATASTPLSTRTRYPKEDPTLEYGAYDNPALTPSPVFESKQDTSAPVVRRQESSF